MKTNVAAGTTTSPLLSALAAVVIGIAVVSVVGLVHAQTLHDAAHDVRHATGFPCH